MLYECCKCGKQWIVEDNDKNEIPSHGLCFQCMKQSLTPIYRARQKRESNPDCFGKANGYCDQLKCIYYKICVEGKIN